jgi:hypothetical protein
LYKVFAKLKDLEEDKLTVANSQNSATSFNKTATSSSAASGGGFFSASGQQQQTTSQFYPGSQQQNQRAGRENEFIPFKNIKENQLVTHS